MRGLLYKNFLLYRIDLIVIACIQLIVSLTVIIMSVTNVNTAEEITVYSTVLYFSVFIVSDLFEQQMFAPDEKKSVSCFIISAPEGLKGHVRSKYFTILIVNLAILFCCFVTDMISKGILGVEAHSVGLLCLLFFFVNLFFSAFSTPFYIRFGASYGNRVKFGTLGVIILIAAIYGLFGDISFLFKDDPMSAVIAFFSSGKARLFQLLIPVVSLILYYVSYRISIALYRKGSESYEQ